MTTYHLYYMYRETNVEEYEFFEELVNAQSRFNTLHKSGECLYVVLDAHQSESTDESISAPYYFTVSEYYL